MTNNNLDSWVKSFDKKFSYKNPDKYKEKKAISARKNYLKNIEARRSYQIRFRLRLRDETYSHYGGYKCYCCSESEPLFLTLDHINNDGAKIRGLLSKENSSGRTYPGGSTGLFLFLKKHNFPPGIQVACYNCNSGRYRNNGICPHEKARVSCL